MFYVYLADDRVLGRSHHADAHLTRCFELVLRQSIMKTISSPYYLLFGAVISILAILLFWTSTIDPDEHNLYHNSLRQIREVDSLLNQGILKLRQGLLTYYDPLVNNLKIIDQHLDNISSIPNYI